MNRAEYFEDTLKRCEQVLKQDPAMIPLTWVIVQLKYLIDLERGNVKDFSGLDKIKIGWIATKEMDGYEDQDLIHALCVVSNEVDKMILERRIDNDKSKNK